jgi:hypothetical protein
VSRKAQQIAANALTAPLHGRREKDESRPLEAAVRPGRFDAASNGVRNPDCFQKPEPRRPAAAAVDSLNTQA